MRSAMQARQAERNPRPGPRPETAALFSIARTAALLDTREAAVAVRHPRQLSRFGGPARRARIDTGARART